MPTQQSNLYPNQQVYYGDIHNHCNMSYGHGSLSDALSNARQQLDFVSVTIHAAWHDLPTDDPALAYLVDYHRKGFQQAQANWSTYLRGVEAHNDPGAFVTFPSFEWHSIEYGDYCIYYKDGQGSEIIEAPDLEAMRHTLRTLDTPTFLIPHHIGYRQGSRGINWAAFTNELSPVVEIFSFHGSSERTDGPYPYLHSMGPRHEQSTAHYGWAQGHVFGVVGSTDHHNAMPGSYGYGRLAVWAHDLTRDAIWDAIRQRRTYALTGDRIALAFTLNNTLMGDIAPTSSNREIVVDVEGGGALDYVDVLHNNTLIHRETIYPSYPSIEQSGIFKVHFEIGWGELDEFFEWDVAVRVDNGTLQEVEPRLRGQEPTAEPSEDAPFAYSHVQHNGQSAQLQTITRQNRSLHTSSTEGMCLTLAGDAKTQFHITLNGVEHDLCLGDIMTGAQTFYTGGFVSPALCVHRAVPESEFRHRFTFQHQHISNQRDWYTVRVRQHNNQWAWSSPIWVDESANP